MNRFINFLAGVAAILFGIIAFVSEELKMWNHTLDFSLFRWLFTPICLAQGILLINHALRRKVKIEEGQLEQDDGDT